MEPLYRYLAWKYGAPRLLRHRSTLYPVITRADGAGRCADSILGPLADGPAPDYALDPRFASLGLFNGPVYHLEHLGRRLRCRPGSYFESMTTRETVELELLENLTAFDGDFAAFDRRLVRRAAVRAWTGALGVATLVVHDGHVLLGRLAAKSVPHRAGQLHVVPSGMFAPPYSVVETVRQELREELGLELDPARLYFSGMALNLLNMRPEICTLLRLDGPAPARLNDEFKPGLLRIPLTQNKWSPDPGAISPAGAGALFLGLRLLQTLNRAAKLS